MKRLFIIVISSAITLSACDNESDNVSGNTYDSTSAGSDTSMNSMQGLSPSPSGSDTGKPSNSIPVTDSTMTAGDSSHTV